MSPAVPERRTARTGLVLLACSLAGLAGLALVAALPAQSASGMLNTKHNLALSGPGPIQGLTETRICVFCHTPHNAAPDSPLWNRELEPQFYTVYASPTLRAGVLPQPFGPTKLCLSCHDGTIAMGAVLNPAGGIQMSGSDTLPPGSLSDFGLDLSGHHPVSFSYNASLPNPELEPTPSRRPRLRRRRRNPLLDLSRSAPRRLRQIPGQGQPFLRALRQLPQDGRLGDLGARYFE